MNMIFGLVVACLAVAANGFPNNQIVGGSDAPIGKYPYQVSLRKDDSHFCGGSIISKKTILTAAHCIILYTVLPRELDTLTVHAGTNRLSQDGKVYKVEKAIVHKEFSSVTLSNDIGLLILTHPVEYSNLIQPIALATTATPIGTNCVLSGWGRTRVGGPVPDKLQHIKLKVHDQNKCKANHWQVQSSHICTLTKAGEGACHGDSGSPLVANDLQIGIVSFGRPCAVGIPDVFTRISVFKIWILDNLIV